SRFKYRAQSRFRNCFPRCRTPSWRTPRCKFAWPVIAARKWTSFWKARKLESTRKKSSFWRLLVLPTLHHSQPKSGSLGRTYGPIRIPLAPSQGSVCFPLRSLRPFNSSTALQNHARFAGEPCCRPRDLAVCESTARRNPSAGCLKSFAVTCNLVVDQLSFYVGLREQPASMLGAM